MTSLIEVGYQEADCFYYRALARYKIGWLDGALVDVEQSLAFRIYPQYRQAAESFRAEIEAALSNVGNK